MAFPKGTQAVYKRSRDKLLGRNSVNAWGEVAAVNTGEEAKRLGPQWLSQSVICALCLKKRPKGRGKLISLYSKMWLFLDSSWVRT